MALSCSLALVPTSRYYLDLRTLAGKEGIGTGVMSLTCMRRLLPGRLRWV
ncbi:hypothetical protein JMJ77_0011699 [Colletotrichum scovillei]|uniref:Uncharacterized protein n=1 Tax=Colletotrichum scovillei TaxID=1209932 RepID=A0A9P7QVF7_9PEZI|nr:hypothetical protein JMJ77_0011699 [Colletotrichum scovillei]KAG7045978.1 hypothetical protein JMJ78_0011049 [Colletotrichum scovillei]KAG7063326.1 hypothetical protein JMJ76_0005794 [Colletotrichum scovillei]